MITRLRDGHASSELRGAFGEAFEAFWQANGRTDGPFRSAATELDGQQIDLLDLCKMLWHCSDVLPAGIVGILADYGFAGRNTYAAAAQFVHRQLVA